MAGLLSVRCDRIVNYSRLRTHIRGTETGQALERETLFLGGKSANESTRSGWNGRDCPT